MQANYLFPDFLSILKFFDAKLVRASDHGDTEMGLLVSYVHPLSVNNARFLPSTLHARQS